MIDNLDLFEMHEREQERRIRRMERFERADKTIDKKSEEERASNEKRATGKD